MLCVRTLYRICYFSQYVQSKSGETITVINPATEETVTSDVQVAGPEDVDAAVAAAKAAFRGPWRKFSGPQRAACMNKMADLIDANTDELARLESIAMGQPMSVAKYIIQMCPPGWRCTGNPHLYRSKLTKSRLRWICGQIKRRNVPRGWR